VPLSLVHLDADAFFASVEQAADPRLRGKPVAVGGEKRGIIASASYEARRCGIYTPMPTVRARKLCPKLIVLPGDFDKYEQFSRWMFSYAYDFTPDVEISSIDEGYADLSGARRPAIEIARTIQQAIQQALKISVSEGVGSNKLICQIASKLRKPRAFETVAAGQERIFLEPLPNHWLPGVGPKTAARLNAAGLARIGQMAGTPLELLELLLGSAAHTLRQFAQGIDSRPVVPTREPAKSYGQQETFPQDQTDEAFLEAVLRRMADRLMAKVRADGKSIRTLTVKVRYNDMTEDQCGESLAEPTDLETDLYGRLSSLLRQAWKRRVSLRLVALKLSQLYNSGFRTELLLDDTARQHEARRRLAIVMDRLRQEHGPGVLMRGHDLLLRAVAPPDEGRRQRRRAGTSGEPPSERRPQPPARVDGDSLRLPPAPVASAGQVGGQASSPDRPTFTAAKRRSRRPAVYLPLAMQSYYTFLDSTLSPSAVVALAQQYQLPAIAIADRGNLHGAVSFTQAAQAAGIRPLLGARVEFDRRPLWLYVATTAGYHNLCRILSDCAAEPSFQEPGTGPEGGASVLASRLAAQASAGGASVLASRLHIPASSAAREYARPTPPRFIPAEQARQRMETLPEPQVPFGGPRSTPPWNQSLARFARQLSDTAGLIAVSPDPVLAPLFPQRFYLAVAGPEANRRPPGAGSLPAVAVLPVCYGTPADRLKYDVVQSIRTLTLLRQEHPDKRLKGAFHFRSPAFMQERFKEAPALWERTGEIAERCCFTLPFQPPQFPAFQPPDGSTPREFLRQLVLTGLRRRYPTQWTQRQPQVEEELRIIHEVGYEEYFLVVWGLLEECRRRGIEWITRGSAADSLVCYCLGISQVCPLRFDLYFRRFLNRERMALNKLPDIDLDFPHDRKDDVVDLIFEQYGSGHAAVVGGFSTFQARSAVADIAKVLGVSEYQIRRFTEHFPWASARDAGELIPHTLECRDLPWQEEPYRTALELAAFLDGFPRHAKMHPCGVVLSRQPMHELTPTFISAKGYPTTHFDMDAVEAIGLVKIDILAQGGLAVMRDVCRHLADRGILVDLERCVATHAPDAAPELARESNAGVRVPEAGVEGEVSGRGSKPRPRQTGAGCPPDPTATSSAARERLPAPVQTAEPWTDPIVWDMIAGGGARAVHHIESPAMVSLCRQCQVRDIDGLIAIVSVIRPGAANESKKLRFARRYQGLEPVTYPHPSLSRCLRSTFGLVVYEEHILQICEAFAGLSPGRADILRRALGKLKRPVIEEIKTEFYAAAQARGHDLSLVDEVWGLVSGFAGYAFCQAHSTAYGVEAYQSAWLKRYFPAEFMAAVLTHGKGFYHPLVYVLECHRLGIPLVSPSINQPGPHFSVVRVPAENSALTEAATFQWRERRSPDGPMRRSYLGGATGYLATTGAGLKQRPALLTAIRPPVTRVKGLTEATQQRLLAEHAREAFGSLADFYRRVLPSREEMEALIRVGAGDEFGATRTAQFWQLQQLHQTYGHQVASGQGWLWPPSGAERLPEVLRVEPTRLERLTSEMELLGFTASGHPLELYPHIAWSTYCPVSRLAEHVGQEILTCGLIVEQRTHHQVTGEPMKFLTLADWTGMVETELFAATYRSYGLTTLRYPVLEITATVEPFENGRGFTLRVLRAGKPRTLKTGPPKQTSSASAIP
jgi:DNA polymerase III alpha subunit/nucleotidyltransferase/DNA polymerase involved in DNA repair